MKERLLSFGQFLLLSVSMVAISCMKSPEINKDFGPEVTKDQLLKEFRMTVYQATENSVKKIKNGEFVYFEKTSQIESTAPIVIKQKTDTITDISEPPGKNKIIYTISHQVVELDFSSGNTKSFKFQSITCLEKIRGSCDMEETGLNALNKISRWSLLKKTEAPVLSLNSSEQKSRSTYHNLKVVNSLFPRPSLASMRSDCGSPKNSCSTPLKALQVSFDEVDWSSESFPVKFSYNFIFSQEVPFLAFQLSSCISTTVAYQNQRVALMQCEAVKDFTGGIDQ